MTAPGGDTEDQAAGGSGARPAAAAAGAPRLRRGQLVVFTAADVILGGSYDGAGVVVATGGDGEPVTIRPLAAHSVLVAADDVSPVSADDVS